MNTARHLVSGLLACLAATWIGAAPLRAQNPNWPQDGRVESAPDRLLVKFHAGVPRSDQDQVHARMGGVIESELGQIGVQVITVPTGRTAEAIQAYRSDRSVAFAEPDYIAHAASTTNDPYFLSGYQWNLTKIQAPAAWDYTKASSAMVVAVLDSGINSAHPELSGKVVGTINFSISPLPDVTGHGSAVAGIVGATTNNGVGVAALGYNASILNVKVIDDSGTALYSAIINGILWATDNGAKVINMSVGGTGPSVAMEDAVNYAWNHGVILAAAAGNSGNSSPIYPAYYPNVIAVAATDITDQLVPYSNRGDWVDVGAPGDSIWSTTGWGTYGYESGTSMASPHVAALAALALTRVADSNGNGRLNDEARACIQNNTDNIGVAGIGTGRINAYKTVLCGSAGATTGTLTGRVTDASNGAAIAGATVTAGTTSRTTDATGSYSMTGLTAGTYFVSVAASTFLSDTEAASVPAGGTATMNFALTKAVTTGTITGKVSDASTAAGIAGATVTVAGLTATTDLNGNYTVSSLTAGTYTETASASGYSPASKSVTITSGTTTTSNLALTKLTTTGNISGRVTDAATGAGIAGATVTAGTTSRTTDSTGSYTMTGLTTGTYLVTAAAAGYFSGSLSGVSVTSGGTTSANLALTKTVATDMWVQAITFATSGRNGLKVDVAVVSASGPVSGATVTLQLSSSGGKQWTFQGTTSSVGHVTFSANKAFAGSYTATVTNVSGAGYVWNSSKGQNQATFVK